MKKLDEKLSLLRMAQAFGITPDPKLVEEIDYLQKKEAQRQLKQAELKERVHKAGQDLFEAPAAEAEYKRPDHYPDGKPIPKQLPDLYQSANNKMVPTGQNCHNCNYMQDNGGCSKWGGAQVRANYWCAKWEKMAKKEAIKEEVLIAPAPVPETLVDRAVRSIKETVVSQGEPALVPGPSDPLTKKVELLEKWISKVAALGPGSGEVNLRWLDDVNRSAIADGQYLRYDSPTKKFTFDAGFHNAYYLSAQSNQTQTSSATSATAMTFNQTDSSYGISVDGGSSSQIIIANSGVYNLQFSSQFQNTGNANDDVTIWLRQNNADVTGSAGIVTVPAKDNNNSPGKIISSWNYYVTTTSTNETIQLMWFVTDETHTTMPYVPATAATASSPAIPAVASVILTVSPVKVDSY